MRPPGLNDTAPAHPQEARDERGQRKASVGIRTRDPHLTKMVRYHCATEARPPGSTVPPSAIIGGRVRNLKAPFRVGA